MCELTWVNENESLETAGCGKLNPSWYIATTPKFPRHQSCGKYCKTHLINRAIFLLIFSINSIFSFYRISFLHITRMKFYALLIFFSFGLWLGAFAEQCGRQAGRAVCPNGLCCSTHGWCGTTEPYCGAGCQSQCRRSGPTPNLPPSGGGGVGGIITSAIFDQMLKYRNDPRCRGNGFYSYNAFITAARSFSGFGTTGDDVTRRRELAAFLAQTSHETTG